MPAAANIDEAITYGPANISAVSEDPAKSLLVQLDLWISSIYQSAIFPHPRSRATRNITDWAAPTFLARQVVASQGAGFLDTDQVAVASVLDAVNRMLWAVKTGVPLGYATAGQEAAVVAAYNAAWA